MHRPGKIWGEPWVLAKVHTGLTYMVARIARRTLHAVRPLWPIVHTKTKKNVIDVPWKSGASEAVLY